MRFEEVRTNRGYRARLLRILTFLALTFLIIPGFFNLFLSAYGIQPLFTVNGSLFQLFGLFAVALLVAKIRKELKEQPYTSVRPAERLTFALLSYLAFTAYLFSRFIIPFDPSEVGARVVISSILYFLGVILLALTCMGARFFKEHRREVFAVIDITIVFAVLTWALQQLWPLFAGGVLRSTAWLLDTFFGGVSTEGITLAFQGFSVDIGSPCSGIVSLGMFTALFILFAAYEWPRLKKGPAAMFFILGALGMYGINILRIFTLMLIGAYWSPSLAIDAFHANVGWISFIIYFAILIPLAYRFLIKK